MTEEELNALKAEVQQSRLEFQIMQAHAKQDAAEIANIRAERDKLRDQWSDLLIEQARLMALRDEAVQQRDAAIAERDALRKELAKFPTLDGALLVPCNALAVQPSTGDVK